MSSMAPGLERQESSRGSTLSLSGRRHALTSDPVLYTRLDSLDLRDSNYVLPIDRVWFDPMSTFRGYWDTLVLLCIIYTMLFLPIHIAFDYRLDAVEWSVDAFFLVDVLLNFETGYSFRGRLVMERRKVRKRYLTTWFAIDLISSIPSEIVLMHLRHAPNPSPPSAHCPSGMNSAPLCIHGLRTAPPPFSPLPFPPPPPPCRIRVQSQRCLHP
mmetsp:Transcript_6108/g.17031  ORF Transcript_6108/g.17031 Transcript_6108/m.17031 type:complete len:213 (+) Transcript_6108:300-938(+)